MAIWAFVVAGSAIGTLIVTAVGLTWIKATLDETRKAVDSADDAVKVARDIGSKQVRAYVSLSYATVKDCAPGEVPKLQFRFKNFGQTPARNMSYKIKMSFGNARMINTRDPLKDHQATRSDLGPNSETISSYSSPAPLPQREYDFLKSGEYAFWAYGVVRYETVFGITKRTTFFVYTGGNGIDDENRLAMVNGEKHNIGN